MYYDDAVMISNFIIWADDYILFHGYDPDYIFYNYEELLLLYAEELDS